MKLASAASALLVGLSCSSLLMAAFGQVATPVEVTVTSELSGLGGTVTDIRSIPGDPRLFVVTKDGLIRIVTFDAGGNAFLSPSNFLDIGSLVIDSGERGLLGLAFHPQFATNGHLFVHYSEAGSGDGIIRRYTVTDPVGNPDVADSNSGVTVLHIPQPATNHNGGCIQFGPDDGMLYIGMGDGGSSNDGATGGPYAQRLDELLGKMLRVNVTSINSADPLPRYAIPSDNPFPDSPIWAYGLRNPWRFAFDRTAPHNLWIADVGQNDREEIDLWRPDVDSSGRNYGWCGCEGFRVNDNTGTCGTISQDFGDCGPGAAPDMNYSAPLTEYDHNVGRSITGGYVYRGSEYAAEMDGIYFYTDYEFEGLYGLAPDGAGGWTAHDDQAVTFVDPGGFVNPTTFGEDSNGELYVGTGGGGIFRVRAVVTLSPPTGTPTLSAGPSAAPTASAPPSASAAPTTTPVCPEQYDTTVSIPTLLQGGLVLSYSARPDAQDASNGFLCVSLVYGGEAWLGFGRSPGGGNEDGEMVGSDVAVGKPLVTSPSERVRKYDLTSRSASGVEPMLTASQTLLDAKLVRDTGAGTTTLSFAKLLKESGELEIVEGQNVFVWAIGDADDFLGHADRGSITLDFTPCSADGDCQGGTFCSPRKCDAQTNQCYDGPSPCASSQTCVEPACATSCSDCSTESDCSTVPSCSWTSTLPACYVDSGGLCTACGTQAECADAGCNWNTKKLDCKGGGVGLGGGTGSCGGTCSTSPGGDCLGTCDGACSVTESPEVTCDDGADNDCDGLTDGADPDCQTCTVNENPEVSCSDGLDNDCDGLTDGADPDCQTCTVTEDPEVSCSDGEDNDCDGQTDSADPDCQTCSNNGGPCSSNADCCSPLRCKLTGPNSPSYETCV